MSIRTVATRLGSAALDLIFPPRCAACGRDGEFLCATCADELTPAAGRRCSRCWRPLTTNVCQPCAQSPPAFAGLRAAFVYQGPARELVRALKFHGITAVVPQMAALLAETVREHEIEAELIVPVPLAGVRRRTRGYNQTELLARALGQELALPMEAAALVRQRNTSPQTELADAESRRRNVADAFAGAEQIVEDMRVLLVDDVTTTGATLEACARALKHAGAQEVWALAFARED